MQSETTDVQTFAPEQRSLIGVPLRGPVPTVLHVPRQLAEVGMALHRRRPVTLPDGRVVVVTEFLRRVIEARSREVNPDPLSDDARRQWLDEALEEERLGKAARATRYC